MLGDPAGSRGLPPSTWRLMLSLYISQYLGIGFFLVALVAILRQHGESLERLSIVYLLGMVWVAKFLWAPLVDRIGFARGGHFKGWLLVMQSGMVAVLLLIGVFDPVRDFTVVYALCLLLALFSATQDIAIDGLACRLLPTESRGMGNGFQIAGGLLGNLLGAGGVLMAYPLLGWQGATALLAIGTGLSLVQLIGFREPLHPRASRTSLSRRVWSVWRNPGGGRLLAMVALYSVGVSLAYALITPILVDAGWALERIGLVVNVVGTLLGVPATLCTGWLIRRVGRRVVTTGAAVLQVPAILAMSLPVLGYVDDMAVTAAMSLFFVFYNPAMVVLATLMMDRASPESPATDYAAQYGLYQFFCILSVTAGTALAGRIGYLPILVASAVSGVLMAMIAPSYRHVPEGRFVANVGPEPEISPCFSTGKVD